MMVVSLQVGGRGACSHSKFKNVRNLESSTGVNEGT